MTTSQQRGRGRPGPGGRRPRGRFMSRRKACPFCVDKVIKIDYKDAGRLRRFISDRSRMEPKRKTGVCAGHQRELSVAIKRARHLALIPFTSSQQTRMVF
jgi:small subunit ribosomal protein S18